MKVLAVILLTVGAVYAGSGPYLPSGWKPSGPAFYLPGEVEKTSENPLKDSLQVEPAGSDSLREYGPPDVIEPSQEQNLPEVATEQAFKAINSQESREAINENLEQATEELTTEQIQQSDAITETVTEVDVTGSTEAAAHINTDDESVTEANDQENVVDVDEAEEKSVAIDLPEVRENNGEAQNIAEALAKLEDDIKEIQVDDLQAVSKSEEIGKVQAADGAEKQTTAEGFLEYGPPGFSEYGPPKEQIVPLAEEVVKTNEARRRRFSPKFRAAKSSQQY